MGEKQVQAIPIEAHVLARIERLVIAIGRRTPGATVKRASAVRLAVLRGLERAEADPELTYRPGRPAPTAAKRPVSFQAEEDLAARIDRLLDVIRGRMPGVLVRRPDALRVALLLGLEVLEPELGLSGTPRPRTRRTRAVAGARQ